MKPSFRVMLLAATAAAVSLPVVAQADHKPGHTGGGGGGAGTLTITAAPNPIVFGSATKLSGRLTGPNNGGVTVTLRQDEFPYNSDLKDVATTKTDNTGNFSFTRLPVRNTSYQAVVGTTVSTGVIVNVRIRMGLRVSDATPRVGQLVTFRGQACPRHDDLLVALKRRTSTGGFVTVRRTRLKAGAPCSVYARAFRIYRDGAYRAVTDDADHAKGVSPTRFIDVHR